MSSEAIVWAKAQRTGSPGTQCLLYVLADYADSSGYVAVPHEKLSILTQQSEKLVRKQLRTLDDCGLIALERGDVTHRGKGDDPLWLCMPAQDLRGGAKLVTLQTSTRSKRDTEESRNALPDGKDYLMHGVTELKNRGPVKRVRAQKTSIQINFEKCWEIFPKRVGRNSKSRALKNFSKLVRAGVQPDELLSAAKSYYEFCKRDGSLGTQYVMAMSNFYGESASWMEDWDATPTVSGKVAKRKDGDDNDFESMLDAGLINVIQ